MKILAATLLRKSNPCNIGLLQCLDACPDVENVFSATTFLQLLKYRPDILLSDFGSRAVSWGVLYRTMFPRSRLLINLTEPIARFGMRERFILARADGVLADGDITMESLRQYGLPAGRIFPLGTPIETGLLGVQDRTVPADRVPHRLAYVGDMSPQHGAADLLVAITCWAEQNKERALEIWWIGNGDLAGVLRAQPLPANVCQKFLPDLEPQGIMDALKMCSILAVPSLTGDHHCPLEEALASGLPVLGSSKDIRVRRLVREDFNGWLFDPLQQGAMLAALERAMGSTADHLAVMRQNACCVAQPTVQHFQDRLHHAVRTMMHGSQAKRGGPSARWAPARSAR